MEEKTKLDQPNTVKLVSFENDEVFGRWTVQQNFRGFFELPDGCYEHIIEEFYKGMHINKGKGDLFVVVIMGRHLYIIPKLIGNLLGIKYKGVKLRATRDEEEIAIPVDY